MKWLLASTLVLAFIWISCGSSADGRQLAAAQSDWDAAGFDSYTLVYSRSCECDDLSSGRKRVSVVDGSVVSVTYLDGAGEQILDPFTYGHTVESLFAIIDDHIRPGIVNEVEYSAIGYPQEINLDVAAIAADGGVSISVHELQPLSD